MTKRFGKLTRGAAATPTTVRALRSWGFGILRRTFACLVAFYVADIMVLRFELPGVVATMLLAVVALAVIGLFAQVGSYVRLSLTRTLLSRTDWKPVSARLAAVSIGPLVLFRVAVLADDAGGADEYWSLRPGRFARLLRTTNPLDRDSQELWMVEGVGAYAVFSKSGGNVPVLGHRLRGASRALVRQVNTE